MPVLFEEKRIFFSSAENEAPEIAVVARNCSIVYCFEGRPEGAARPGAAARAKARPARGKRRKNVMDRSSSQQPAKRRTGAGDGPGACTSSRPTARPRACP